MARSGSAKSRTTLSYTKTGILAICCSILYSRPADKADSVGQVLEAGHSSDIGLFAMVPNLSSLPVLGTFPVKWRLITVVYLANFQKLARHSTQWQFDDRKVEYISGISNV